MEKERRYLSKKIRFNMVFYIAVLFSVYQLYTAIVGPPDVLIHRPIHLSFALVLVFLLYPVSKNSKVRIYDLFLAIVAVGLCYFSITNYERLIWSVGKYETFDIIFGAIGIAIVLEACRRVIGLPLLIVATSFIIYAVYGNYFPGFLVHKGYSLERVISHLYLTTEGVMGIPLGASATFIFLFLIFGSLLKLTGVADYFLDLSLAITGRNTGGPAKGAVVSSAFFGSISGSSIANVMSTGSFTIPMMKKLGYRREFAASVEAASSTGGQLMPPVMGTAAFLMAELLGVSYWTVVKAAVIPGTLYFIGVFFTVHFESKLQGLHGLSSKDLPNIKKILINVYMIAPLVTIVIFLSMGMTPIRSALYSMIVALIVGIINPKVKLTIQGLIKSLEDSAKAALSVVVATATAGIIVGVVTLTGLGMKMGNGLISVAGNSLLIILILVAVTSLILGMGVPTAPNYIITSTVAAPALIVMGVPPLVASMFVLYFGIISDVTPPVCLSAFAASSIAKSNLMKTGVQSSKTAIGGFIIPFAFVLNPDLLLIETNILSVTFHGIAILVGLTAISSALVGYLIRNNTKIEKYILFVAAFLSISPGYISSSSGIILIIAILIWQFIEKKRNLQINKNFA